MNNMKIIRIEKLTLNIGAGKSTDKLDKGINLLEIITGTKPAKTITNKRIAGWGLRPGLPIGCKVTIRGKKAAELLKRLFGAVDNKLKLRQFDNHGNIAFGIPEYIEIPDIDYDPNIGTLGLQVCVTLSRPGFRIKNRRLQKKKIDSAHAITSKDAIDFIKSTFKVEVAN